VGVVVVDISEKKSILMGKRRLEERCEREKTGRKWKREIEEKPVESGRSQEGSDDERAPVEI
jgi:hypothetical protein